jgi:sulfur carrier protein|tara:strand:+ start:5434 stop:5658 length:225 start_codon:yes stop_codon:yes gene_type:complete
MKTNFTIKVFINGKKYEFKLKKHINIQHLIKLLYKKNKSIVVDYNKKIIQKNMWDNIYIQSNDKIEILTIVGGG